MELDQTHIHLIGNPEDSFYSLGKKDKIAFGEIYEQISKLCARNSLIATVIKTTTELSNQISKKNKPYNASELKAYAEGLGRPLDELLFSMLLPEVVASFNKWTPNLMGLIPGCSSLFVQDPKNGGVIHTRILDYALSGPFEKNERSLLYDFHGRKKIFSHSTAGMPLPSLSAMNEDGLTMALHYKHGDFFDLSGESIFNLSSELISTCDSIRDAIKFLRKKKSISYWGIYLSDPSGEVVSVDICGSELYQEKYDTAEHPYLYFNNKHLLKHKNFNNLQPFGGSNQCQMRRESFEQNLGQNNLKTSKDIMLESIKVLGNASKNAPSEDPNSAKDWKLSPITPSSIQFFSFHNALKSSYKVSGSAPKFFQENLIKYENIFKSIKITEPISTEAPSNFVLGYRRAAKYQSAIDMGDTPKAYHEIQMAIELFTDYDERVICEFYFLVTQYLYEADSRDLSYLYASFEQLSGRLPNYLEDHRILFMLRLEKILGLKVKDLSQRIKNNKLKELYTQEYKLNSFAMRRLKSFIFPRIEILDIIYAY